MKIASPLFLRVEDQGLTRRGHDSPHPEPRIERLEHPQGGEVT